MNCICEENFEYHEFVECIASALDARDPYTGNHSERVSDMACELCHILELPEEQAQEIHIAGHLHDIGKIGIPDRVLLKEGRLTLSAMSSHVKASLPQLGEAGAEMPFQQILGGSEIKLFRLALVDAAVQAAHQAIVEGGSDHIIAAAQDLRRGEPAQLGGGGGGVGADGDIECAGGNIAESKAELFAAIQAGKIVVLALLQHTAFGDGAGGDNAGDLPLHKALGGGGICHLFADGYLVTLLHQPCDVGIHTVIRNAAHGSLLFLGLTAVTGGQSQIQLPGGHLRVLVEHFIEIAQTEKQDAVLIIVLDRAVLPPHGRHFRILGGHRFIIPSL